MSVLRILRKLAVLFMFAIAVFASTPRAAAHKPKACSGGPCGYGYPPCCGKLVCETSGGAVGQCVKTGA
jgi:hypothetical protein